MTRKRLTTRCTVASFWRMLEKVRGTVVVRIHYDGDDLDYDEDISVFSKFGPCHPFSRRFVRPV